MFQEDNLGLNILVIHKYFKIYLKKSLKKYNLNVAEGLVLIILSQEEKTFNKNFLDEFHKKSLGKTQDEIIRELHYDKGVMTRTMKSLEEKGYVIRENNPHDSRSFIFKLTSSSINLRNDLLKILNNWHNILLEDMDDESIELIKKHFSKMTKNLIKSIKS